MTVLMAVSAPVILPFVKLTPQVAEYLKPVSYTHLDVYKKQAVHLSDIPLSGIFHLWNLKKVWQSP